MCGRATLRIVLSRPCMMFASMIEIVIMPRFGTGAYGSPLTVRSASGDPARDSSGRDLFHGRRVAGDGGAAHVANLALVEAAHPVHHLPVVPDDEIVLPPFVDIDELRLGRVFGQVAQQGARF